MQTDSPSNRRGAWARAWIAGCALLGTSACSVADNLSFAEIVNEIDGIVTIVGDGPVRSVRYADRAPVAAWYMRQFWLVPMRWALGPVFGYSAVHDIDNPAGHVRELLQELPDETGGDLLSCAQATTRCGWLAEVDANGHSRVVAIDGLVAVAQQLALPVFAGDFAQLGVPLAADRHDASRRVIASWRPDQRGGDLGPADRAGYTTALQELTARPLASWTDRLLLVEDLVQLQRAERDELARVATEAALRAGLRHCIEGILLRTVEGRDPRYVEVRLCAMEQIRRLAGPRGVGLLLAVMSATPQQLARFEPRFDPDPLVQLRLIHFCGQLRGEVATTEVRLPGRETGLAVAPVDFLAQTILTEQAYYSKLRTPAMAALSLCLGRPSLDPDPAWVREWYRERQAHG